MAEAAQGAIRNGVINAQASLALNQNAEQLVAVGLPRGTEMVRRGRAWATMSTSAIAGLLRSQSVNTIEPTVRVAFAATAPNAMATPTAMAQYDLIIFILLRMARIVGERGEVCRVTDVSRSS